MFSHHKLKFICHWLNCQSDKQDDTADVSWSDVSSASCVVPASDTTSARDCNSPDGTAETHQSKSDAALILTTRTGQYSTFQEWEAFYVLTFSCFVLFFLQWSPKKRCRDIIQYAFLVYFCRKISLFTCKSIVFIKEYEKNLCQGIPEWHSRKCTFYKRHRKTHKHTNACMNQSLHW